MTLVDLLKGGPAGKEEGIVGDTEGEIIGIPDKVLGAEVEGGASAGAGEGEYGYTNK